MADALCGPSNPLQSFQKYATTDRALQQDRLVSRQSPAQGFRTPNPNAGILDAEFEAFKAGHPIAFEPFQPQQAWQTQHISHFQPNLADQNAPGWASDFQNLSFHEARAIPLQAAQFRQEAPLQRLSPNAWHQEFMQQNQSQSSNLHQSRLGGGRFGPATTAGNYNAYSPQFSTPVVGKQSGIQDGSSFDEAAFEKAFDAATLDVHQEESIQQREAVGEAQPAEHSSSLNERVDHRIGFDKILDDSDSRQEKQSEAEDADELARTAGQLLENVKHDQSAKFQQSNFLYLMRQLRDKEVKIEGDKIVDAEQPLHPGGQGYPNSKGELPANEDTARPRPTKGKARASSVPRRGPNGFNTPGVASLEGDDDYGMMISGFGGYKTRENVKKRNRGRLRGTPGVPSFAAYLNVNVLSMLCDGSSVSEKLSLHSTALPCDDDIAFIPESTSNPLSTSDSTLPPNPPPPFSAHYFHPLHPADYAEPSTAESDSCPPPPFAPTLSGASLSRATSDLERATKAAFARDTKGGSSTRNAEDKEPPPPYTEGSSPLGSFTYVMAAAGGPASIITQVPQGGPPLPPGGHSFADVGPEENINLDLRGTRFTLSRDELLTLPEFVLLSLFPNGLLPDGHMNSFHEGDTYPVDYDPTSLQYMLDFFRTVAQTIPSSSPSPVTDTPSTETNVPGSARDMLQDRAGIIVLREDLDFYTIPPKAEIDQSEMIEVKRAAGRALLKQDGIFSGLRKSEEQGTTEQHLIEMLTAGGFYNDDRWGHRASEPNKAVICSLALARLRTDIKGNDLANSNAVGMAQKLLLFWRKPARRCWWEGVELDNVEGIEGKLKVWIRRVWTLEMVLPNEPAGLFQKHLKAVFRINAKARKHEAIRTALSTGYGVLDDLANSKLGVLRQLAELGKEPGLKSNSPRPKGPLHVQVSRSTSHSDNGRRWPYPDAKRVLEGLPAPPSEHHRRVPALVNANHIPFIRYKKPQSPFLGHMIREKTIEREKRIDRIQGLEEALPLAEDEDQWDRILWDMNQVSGNDKGVRWASAVYEAHSDAKNVHARNTRKRVEAAERMFDIVQEQRRLANKDKLERRNRRHQATGFFQQRQ
ncbi:MAG: hypothetical protein Q9218_002066 [Villophora microphyllina]